MNTEDDQGVLEAPGEDRLSKTKLTALAVAVVGVAYNAAAFAGYPIPIPAEEVTNVLLTLLGFGMYFLRRAVR